MRKDVPITAKMKERNMIKIRKLGKGGNKNSKNEWKCNYNFKFLNNMYFFTRENSRSKFPLTLPIESIIMIQNISVCIMTAISYDIPYLTLKQIQT
jgi:hypothetical protein